MTMPSALISACCSAVDFEKLDRLVDGVVNQVLTIWQKTDGSFRTRQLLLGWDNVPMHRWAQAQLFRALCLSLNTKPADISTASQLSE